MKVEFGVIEETAILGFKGGEGVTHARMFADGRNRIMRGRLEPGCSIGLHTHEESSEIVYVLSGTGKALYRKRPGGRKRVRRALLRLPPGGYSPRPARNSSMNCSSLRSRPRSPARPSMWWVNSWARVV